MNEIKTNNNNNTKKKNRENEWCQKLIESLKRENTNQMLARLTKKKKERKTTKYIYQKLIRRYKNIPQRILSYQHSL